MGKQMWLASLFALMVVGALLGGPLGAAAQTPSPSTIPGSVATPLSPTAPITTSGPVTSTARSVTRILFICDSDSFFMAEYLTRLAAAADPPVLIEAVEAGHGGTSLYMQWLMDGEQERVRAGKWDVVILEEDLGDRWNTSAVNQFHDYAGKFAEEIRQAGAQPVLHMVWGDRGVTSPTTDDIAAAYRKTGTDLGIKVAPSGLAFERALKQRPDLDVRAPDGDHQSKYGCYLALCTLYATIFDRSPVGLSYRMPGLGGAEFMLDLSGVATPDPAYFKRVTQAIPDADAEFLQQVAWDTVVEYQAQK